MDLGAGLKIRAADVDLLAARFLESMLSPALSRDSDTLKCRSKSGVCCN